MDDKELKTKNTIKAKIAEQIGVDVEDINDDDSFAEDLHMSAAEFSDFLGSLSELGVADAHSLELTTDSTVEELVDAVASQIIE